MNNYINANVITKQKKIKANIMTAQSATTERAGLIRIATQNEAELGADNSLAITPLTLKLVGDERYANTLELDLDEETYVLTVTLKNPNGTVLSTDTVDFPNEYTIESVDYDPSTQELIFTLKNGNIFSTAITGLQAEITSDNKLSSDLVNDNNNNNKFVNPNQKSLLNDITATANEINILDGAIIDVTELNSLNNITDNVQFQLNDILDNLSLHIADKTNPHEVTKTQLGLGNVDNTSDLDKPISTATQTALDNKVSTSRTINNNPLTSNIMLDYSDVGALPDDTFIPEIVDTYDATSEDGMSGKAVASALESYVPKTTTVNTKALSGNIVLDASDVGALADTVKYGATLAFSVNSETYVLTAQLKDQDGNNLGTAQTVDLPLESVVVNGSYNNVNKKIILTLENGNTIDVPVGDLVAGLQSEITAQNKLDADLVDDTNATHKFATVAQLTQIATNTSDIATINGTLGNYGDVVSHDANEFATSAQGTKADTALQPSDIVSSVDSSSTNTKAVGAKLFYDTCGDIETLINAL